MILVEEENRLLNVCVIDENSRFYNVPNSRELIEELKNQIEDNIKSDRSYGTWGSSPLDDIYDIFFSYSNPKIDQNKLFVDIKFFSFHPYSKTLMNMIKEYEKEIFPYKFNVSMIGEIKDDGSIINPKLHLIYFSKYA